MTGRRLRPDDFPQDDETDVEEDLVVLLENLYGYSLNAEDNDEEELES